MPSSFSRYFSSSLAFGVRSSAFSVGIKPIVNLSTSGERNEFFVTLIVPEFIKNSMAFTNSLSEILFEDQNPATPFIQLGTGWFSAETTGGKNTILTANSATNVVTVSVDFPNTNA